MVSADVFTPDITHRHLLSFTIGLSDPVPNAPPRPPPHFQSDPLQRRNIKKISLLCL